MNEPWAYANGRWLPVSQAAIPLHDAGFAMGVTVSDLARTFGGRLFRWDDHLARFRRSAQAAHLQIVETDAELTSAAEELVRRNLALLPPGAELCVVAYATPGPVGYLRGDRGGLRGPLTLGIHSYPLPFERYRELVERGATLRTPSIAAPAWPPPEIKHRARLHWWLADHEVALRDPQAKALLVDSRGHVTETAIANFLVVAAGRVQTARAGVLPGVSLRVVRELCAAEGVPFEERDLTLDACLRADEALVCGTAFCVAGVVQLDERPFPFPGPMLRRLVARWSEAVGRDIHAPFRAPPARPAPTPVAPRPADGLSDLLRAVSFAATAHAGQVRKDGKTPYVAHVMRVCLVLRERFGFDDPRMLQAAILHDTIEDTTTDFDDLAERFSPEVAQWAATLTKDKRLPDDRREAAYLDALRAAPWQVQVCKLADVYDNLLDSATLDSAGRKRACDRARQYLNGLGDIPHPEARRCWMIVDAELRRAEEP